MTANIEAVFQNWPVPRKTIEKGVEVRTQLSIVQFLTYNSHAMEEKKNFWSLYSTTTL